MTIYHMINWFFGFSVFGYILECIVLSYEFKKPVLDRGFVHGPFCIIYGFGAIGAYTLLKPVTGGLVSIFFYSMLMATMMELLTAKIMVRLFGSFWWNYSHKPFNFRGVICLGSSIGWGFLGIFFFRFLDGFMHRAVGLIPYELEKFVAVALVVYYIGDFIYCVREHLKNPPDGSSPAIGRLKVY